MRIVIDTNAYTAFVRGDDHAVKVFRSASEIYLPVPVMAELRFGFLKGNRRTQNEARIVPFAETGRVTILPCDEQTTHFYAQLKVQLGGQGTPIPINDVWIAAL